jgi:FMN reductase (NADPH)
MTTPTIELIRRHGSVRNYKPDPVPTSMIAAIVSAAQCSSTSSNLQMMTVIAVTDAEKRARVAGWCGNQAHVAQAPLLLVWCADLHRLDRVCELRGYSQVTGYVENFLVAAADAVIVAQTAALAAESLGLGICYIGSIRNRTQDMIELLRLPRLVFPVVGMTVGWPATPPPIRPRLSTSAVLHCESYNQDQEQALYDYDRAMVETGIYEGRQVPVPGKPDTVEDYGWMEHSARRICQPTRTDLRQVLERQGFDLM